MATKTVSELKNIFKTGAIPTATNFGDLFESFLNYNDSQVEISPDNIRGSISDRIFIIPNGNHITNIEVNATIFDCIFISRDPNNQAAKIYIKGNVRFNNCIFINCCISSNAVTIFGTSTFYNSNFFQSNNKLTLQGGFNFYKCSIRFATAAKISVTNDSIWDRNIIDFLYTYDPEFNTLFYINSNFILSNNKFRGSKNVGYLFTFSELTANKDYLKIENNNFEYISGNIALNWFNSKYFKVISIIGNYFEGGSKSMYNMMPEAMNNIIHNNVIDYNYEYNGSHGGIRIGKYLSDLSYSTSIMNNYIKVLNPNSNTYRVTVTFAGTSVMGNIIRAQANVFMDTTNAFVGTKAAAEYNKLINNL